MPELISYLFHDSRCARAREMTKLSRLLSDSDDRSEEEIETLIGITRGLRTAAKFLYPVPDTGIERRLFRIVAPTLVLWGAGDRLIDPSYAEVFRGLIPGSEVVKITEAGHLIGAEQSESYAKELLRWDCA